MDHPKKLRELGTEAPRGEKGSEFNSGEDCDREEQQTIEP
jgi:hypothetical protein